MTLPLPLPTGTVTFLFTDVEGSTRLWEQHPETMRRALARHDALIELVAERRGGRVVRPRGEGDSRFCVFSRATDAVAAAAEIQQALHEEPWPRETPLRVRMALHTGEADVRDGDYYGSAVNRAARLRAIAHGGQTLLSTATEELIRDSLPDGVTLRDLGEHRLKDLARPERTWQLVHPALPDHAAPPRSLDALPHNLPVQLTTFVGREREVSEVGRLLRETRLLTLTGPGGTGKTRLALQAAAEALDRYPDGVWLVELAALAEPAQVARAVAAVLDVRERLDVPLDTVLAAALQHKRLLLVLDNCQHVIDACAALAGALLRACPTLSILDTSREALGIAGERSWRVPSLGLPPDGGAVAAADVAHFEAIALFVERAAAAHGAFVLTDRNAAAVAQICRRLDGIPLAIELAAARVRVLPPEQLLERLEDRFRLLTGGSRTALERQQTLQAAVDWSYALLSDAEKTLFMRLAVFAGGWTLDAAESVGGVAPLDPGNVLDTLTRLIDRSLVQVDEEPAETARYHLLETLRQYARAKLQESGDAPMVFDRHAAWYLALAERRGEYFDLVPDGWLDAMARDNDNVVGALRWLEERGHVQEALQMVSFAAQAWYHRGSIAEGLIRARHILDLPAAAAPTAPRAGAVVGQRPRALGG